MDDSSLNKESRVSPQNRNIKDVQDKVDEVVGVMRDNLVKAMEREHRLSELEERADALEEGAEQFTQATVKLRKKYWWENHKMKVIIGATGLVVVGLIIWLVIPSGSDDEPENP